MPDTFQATFATTNVPAKYNEKGVFAIVSTYEASAVASGDIIQMAKIQAGVTVIGGQLIYDALGASTTLAVGDADSASRFLAATASSSAGATMLMTGGKFPHTYEADDTVDVTVGGAAATGTITLVLHCTADSVDLA